MVKTYVITPIASRLFRSRLEKQLELMAEWWSGGVVEWWSCGESAVANAMA
ncbi:MAG: hypothetical protein LAT55_13320 [Opitutales bacterium]|nr:hypothetical protein [Opitutales bacterium]